MSFGVRLKKLITAQKLGINETGRRLGVQGGVVSHWTSGHSLPGFERGKKKRIAV
jgi:transcriptional regulator with XRE-family HTH domain